MTERFDEQLAGYLRWQAAETAGSPTPLDVAGRIAAGRSGVRRARPRTALVLAMLVIAALTAMIGAAMLGSRPTDHLSLLPGGAVIVGDGGCGLIARDPDTGVELRILGDVPGCPRGSRHVSSFADVYYPSMASTADGTTLVAARQVFCGGCGSTPTPEALAAQGVYVVDLRTGASRRVDTCTTERCGYHVAIAPDGRTMAFSAWPYRTVDEGPSAATPVTVLELTSNTSITVDSSGVGELAFSSDGRQLAIITVADPDSPSTTSNVEVVDVDDGERHPLGAVDGSGVLAWSPDDRSVQVASDIGAVPDGSTYRLVPSAIGVEAGEMRRGPAIDADPGTAAWSRDGRRLAFVVSRAAGDNGALVVVDADGTGSRIVAGGSDRNHVLGMPSWSPDGRAVIIAGQMDVDGTSRSGTFEVGVDDGHVTWLGPEEYVLTWVPGQPTPGQPPTPAAP